MSARSLITDKQLPEMELLALGLQLAVLHLGVCATLSSYQTLVPFKQGQVLSTGNKL